MKASYHCSCGASFSVDDSNVTAARILMETLLEAHRGPGHTEKDARTAARSRQRIEEQCEKEEETAMEQGNEESQG
jgi:hypothetical protein